MMKASPCDNKRIDQFLHAESADINSWLVQHLDTCEDCRKYLDDRAAQPMQWQEAHHMLQPLEFDLPGSFELRSGAPGEASTQLPLSIQAVLDLLAPSDIPHHLGRLGTYEITGVIGAGGMGVVLKAVDPSLDRVVAIKVLAPHLANSASSRKRFAREAKAAAAVLHPNVIPIHSVSSEGQLPWFVMSCVHGSSLQKRLEQESPLSTLEILRIGSQIAAGLAAAHEQGLVHRDIKPANILLEEGVERVRLTDFGLARAVDDASLTYEGTIAGTPQYMSPEQARGEEVDQASDLFSLGSVLYALCCGQPPFRANTSYGVMLQICGEVPTPVKELNPEIPEWLCSLIEKLMAKEKTARFESASELNELLETCLSHLQRPDSNNIPAHVLSRCLGNRHFKTRSPRVHKFYDSSGKIKLTIVLLASTLLLAATAWIGSHSSSGIGINAYLEALKLVFNNTKSASENSEGKFEAIADAGKELEGELEGKYEKLISEPWFIDNGFTVDYEKALSESKRTGKPIFAYFTASYFSCPGCVETEEGLFSTDEFKEWSSNVVLFTAIATNIPGREYDSLAWRKGALALPWFSILDSDGNVTAHLPLNGAKTRNMEGFKTLLVRHGEYGALVNKAEKTLDEKVTLFLHDVSNGNLDIDAALEKLDAIVDASPRQRKAMESAIISFQLQVYKWNTNPDRMKDKEMLRKRCVEWFKAGRQPPPRPYFAKTYCHFILQHAEIKKDLDLFANALNRIGPMLWEQYDEFVRDQGDRLAELKRANLTL